MRHLQLLPISAVLLGLAPGCASRGDAPAPNDVSAEAPSGGSNETKRGPASEAGLSDRDPALAHRLVEEEDALLLDVRSQSEFDAGHAEGAALVPHGEVPDRVAEIEAMVDGDKDRPIVVYCRSGHRAGIAKQSLLDAGFTRVTNVGGLDDYQSAE